ncbi:MAG: glutamate--tRNA ligase [Candidatus Aminicenantes bacterium]
MKRVRVRFAPSPTGFLHVGNARTALFNWLFARQQDGVFILRVEDTDVERSTAEYDRKLMDDLRWLGLDWDEGPDVGGEYGPYRQSQRLDFYRTHAEELLDEDKAYPCFCSRDVLEKERKKAIDAGLTPVYSGKCRTIPKEESAERIASGEKAAIRLLTPDEGVVSFRDLVRGDLQFDLSLIGDPILVRSNGLPAYNYAAVVDDFLMAITHVIRGEDHIQNTPRQILICRALGFDPPAFAHLSMVMGKDNTRLSKRHGATAVEQFDKEGILPSALFNYLALLGWAPPDGQEVLSRKELIQLFRLERVSRSSAIFDYDKLAWISRQHIKTLPSRRKAELAFSHLKATGWLPEKMSPDHWTWLEHAVEAFAEKIDRFSRLPLLLSPVFEFSLSHADDGAKEILKERCSEEVIRSFSEKIASVESFDYEVFGQMAKEIKADTGCKGKDLYHPLRVALTAQSSGLELDKFIPIVEEGTRLEFPNPIKSCEQRALETLTSIDQ